MAPPHILLVLADDLGYANVGWHGAEPIKGESGTPILDSLVESGVRFDRFYTFKFCSPTRCALQSGRNPVRVNVVNGDNTWHNPSDPVGGFAGIPRNMTTIATLVSSAGYITRMAGKWDAGMATPTHTPRGRGYQSSVNYFYHQTDYWTFTAEPWMSHGCAPAGAGPNSSVSPVLDLWIGDDTGEHPGLTLQPSTRCAAPDNSPFPLSNECLYEDLLFERTALQWIQSHSSDKPLFLFWAPHVAHVAHEAKAIDSKMLLQVPRKYAERFASISNTPRRLYSAMVSYLDDATGSVVDGLKAAEMWNSTLLFFSSDNGGPVYGKGTSGANNFPLRGGKMSNFDGGVRVPAFASGGAIPPRTRGTSRSGILTIWDLYATIADAAGIPAAVYKQDSLAEAAGLPQPDSISAWEYICDSTSTPPRQIILLGDADNFKTVVQGIIVDERDSCKASRVETTSLGRMVDTKSRDGNQSVPAATRGLWKLLIGELTQDGWQGPIFPNASTSWDGDHAKLDCGSRGCLFELESDPTEHYDLAAVMPSKLIYMHAMLTNASSTIYSPDRGVSDPHACEVARSRGMCWGPFID